MVATRRSEEVLAGMLTRTGLDGQTSRPGQHHSRNGGGSLTLLRAGCPRPAVQHLYRSEEVGLGQAMGLAEDGCSSDLDSGEIVAGRDVEFHKRVGALPTEASTTATSTAQAGSPTRVHPRLGVLVLPGHTQIASASCNRIGART